MKNASIWTLLVPTAALILVVIVEHMAGSEVPFFMLILSVPILFLTVFAAVHHAEVVAHRIGQPFGSILLALAVTIIEASLIMSILLADTEGDSPVARDTVFAAIMITLNGIVGVCLLIGGIKYHEQGFQARSATSALGVLGTLAVLGLVLPNYTVGEPGPIYAPAQLVFVAVISLSLYALFLFVQMFSHKDDFIDKENVVSPGHAPASVKVLITSLLALPVSLLAVVLLAEMLADPVSVQIKQAGLPEALVGVIIALIVLMPEGISSVRAASSNKLQTSINIALGSALASICLTIPVIALFSVFRGYNIILGLSAEHIVLLVLTLFMSTLSLVTGRTTIIQGGIHLVIFACFITISILP